MPTADRQKEKVLKIVDFQNFLWSDRPLGDPAGARTLDPLIKSQLLYQLSYGVLHFQGAFPLMRCKVSKFFWSLQIFLSFFYFSLLNDSIILCRE